MSTAIGESGRDVAQRLRAQLLLDLDAESEWLFATSEDETTLLWSAGPIWTRMSIVVDERAPKLAALEVVTSCATVDDLEMARFCVHDLNTHTSLNRWAIIDDPGPEFWKPDRDSNTEWRDSIISPLLEGFVPCVAVGATFVVGSPEIELPYMAIHVTVREQIAKAVAWVTNDGTKAFGEPMVAKPPGGEMRREWNDVVFHYDNFVTPNRLENPWPLKRALHDALADCHAQQFAEDDTSWYGSVDSDGFTLEVAYGPHPGPAITTMIPGASGAPNATALVTGTLYLDPDVLNPHLGFGLLLTIRLPLGVEVPWDDGWTTHLLNAQSRTFSALASPVAAHGIGAFVEKDEGPTWALFTPSYWSFHLDHDELVAYFAEVLRNCARLAWGSRVVLETYPDVEALEAGCPIPGGFVAGGRARGSVWGEPQIDW